MNAATPPPSRSRASAARLRLGLLAALCLLAGFAYWLKTRPPRLEDALRTAPLAELQTRAAREPDNARLAYYLALRTREAGHVQEALPLFQRATELAPDDETAWLEWARTAHAALGAQAAYKILDEFLKAHPESARGHLVLAQLYHRSGYYASAYKEAQSCAALSPKETQAWQLMGASGLEAQNYADGEAAFARAIALAPQDWRNHAGHGKALMLLKRNAEALADFQQAARLAPQECEPQLQWGRLLLTQAAAPAEYEAARDHLRQALTLRATLTPQWKFLDCLSLGQSCARQGQWAQARSWLEQAQALVPGDATLQFEMARVYRRLGDPRRAAAAEQKHQQIVAYERDTRALIERIAGSPDDLAARLKLARLYARHGAIADALKTYRFLLLKAPDDATARQEYQTLAEGRAPAP